MKIDLEIYNNHYGRLKKFLRLYCKRHFFENATPLIISFLITNRCFLKCKHCFYHEAINDNIKMQAFDEMSIDEYEKLSHSMDWFLTGVFCGGEPFIRDDFHCIIDIFQKNNKVSWCDSATNGQMTDSIVTQVEKIVKNNKDQIYSLGFSIDGFEEQNDAIRGTGTFKKSMETWRECKKLAKYYKNFDLYICTTMNSINQHILPDFIKWSIKVLEPNKISLLKIRQTPRAGNYLKNIDPQYYKDCKEIICNRVKEGLMGDVNKPQTYMLTSSYDYVYNTMVTGKRSFFCYAGMHGAFVDYNGDIGVCEILPIIGNLKKFDMDFSKLWNSDKAQQIRQLVNKHDLCKQCTHEAEGIMPSIFFEPNELKIIK